MSTVHAAVNVGEREVSGGVRQRSYYLTCELCGAARLGCGGMART